jgi:Tol biopolymer transport system component
MSSGPVPKRCLNGGSIVSTLSRVRAGVLFGAALLALALAPGRSQAVSDSRGEGLVTEIVGESGDAGPSPRLVVMDGDGKHVRLGRGWVLSASISPDRRSIAYTSRTSPVAIWVLATGGRGSGRLLARTADGPDWSPNGDAIAFDRNGGIFIEDLHSRASRRVVRNASMPDWSPDGKELAFVRGQDIWVVDLARNLARRVLRSGYFPRWSPDGDRIAFTRELSFESFVFVARADGTGERRVTSGSAAVWSTDGRELAYCAFRSFIRIRPDGTGRRVVHRGRPACQSLDWS